MAIFSAYILKTFNRNASIILFISYLLFAIAIYFFGWESLTSRGFGSIDPAARSSRYDLLGINPLTHEGYLKFKAMVLNGVIWGIIGPFPSELSSRLEFIPFFIEGLFIFLMPMLAIFLVMRIKIKDRSNFYRLFLLLLFSAILILLIIHAPFEILNPGSSIRWRVNFEQLFYLAPILLIFRFIDVDSKENHSFSS